jgi:hypothetical protein
MKVTGTFRVYATAPKNRLVDSTAMVKHTGPVFKKCSIQSPTPPETYVSMTLNHPQNAIQSTPEACCVVYQIYQAISNIPHSEQNSTQDWYMNCHVNLLENQTLKQGHSECT